MKPIILLALGLSLTLPLTGCVSTTSPHYIIDSQTYHAQGKNQRISSIILHYTAENEAESLRLLTTANVSAHYLIPLAENNTIYQLVLDNERAWHAGKGAFAGRNVLNDTSIGIEIVNEGIKKECRSAENSNNDGYHSPEHFVEFTDTQVQKVAQLIQKLSDKYEIQPTHIIGHSDMAPSRKIDPGAKFPWERLYKEYGIGAWYEEADKQRFIKDGSFETMTILEIKQLFRAYGYAINNTDEWDKPSRDVIYAFQLHFTSHKLTGKMDLETYAILRALNTKYVDIS